MSNDTVEFSLQSLLQSTPGKIKALIIEDETDIRYLVSNILKQRGVQSILAGTLSEAEKIFQQDLLPPSIIFLDNHLPDGFGVNFIEEIKKIHPDVKVVMITAHDTSMDRDKAFFRGVDHFIGKPFTRETILKTLEILIN